MEPIPLGSTYTWSDARARGVTRRQIRDDGVPVARGAYISSAVPDTLHARCRAWSRLLPPDAAFGLETAAVLLGAPVEPSRAVQIVLRPRPVLPQRRGLEAHIPEVAAEVVSAGVGLRLCPPGHLLLHLAARLPPQEPLAVRGQPRRN